MPRFFAQAQQQADKRKALADKRKAFTVPESAMKPTTKDSILSPSTTGLQGALAQMESNAAAAMARFKTFRGSGKDEPTPSPSTKSEDLPDSPIAKEVKSEVPPPDAAAGVDPLLASASGLAALEKAASRYLQAHVQGNPWHHRLRGTNLEFVSDMMDRPLMLLAVAGACLTMGCWNWLWPAVMAMLSVQKLSTLMGLCCLLLAVSGWLLRAAAFMHTQLSAFADTVPRMPHACEEMSAMLVEMRLMRHDLKSMKAKVAWLPGGE